MAMFGSWLDDEEQIKKNRGFAAIPSYGNKLVSNLDDGMGTGKGYNPYGQSGLNQSGYGSGRVKQQGYNLDSDNVYYSNNTGTNTGTNIETNTGTNTGTNIETNTGTNTNGAGGGANSDGYTNTNTSTNPYGGMTAHEIQSQMENNSNKWFDASPEEQKRLHEENLKLGKMLGSMGAPATYNEATGDWDYSMKGPDLLNLKPIYNNQQPTDGNVGVREQLNNAGISNDRIGWITDENGGGSVTVDGKAIVKTADLRDGKAYASASSIADGTAAVLGGNGSVAAADYYAASGSPFSIGYNNGMVDVGGVMVKPTAVINGKAYVSKTDMDNAIKQANANAGIRSNQSIVDAQDAKYNPYYDKLLNNITNRGEFSYDPNSDPVYKSYKDMYTREGNRAMEDSMGSMAGLTGGFMNSAAVTAGGQANNYYMQKLNDVVPQLFDSAYNRYTNNFNMDRQALDSVMGLDNMQFDRNYGANRDTIGDVRDTRDYNYKRQYDERAFGQKDRELGQGDRGLDQRDRGLNIEQQNADSNTKDSTTRAKDADTNSRNADTNAKNADTHANQVESENLERSTKNKLVEAQTRKAEFEDIVSKAKQRGYFTPSDCETLGIKEGTDPLAVEKAMNEMEKNKDIAVVKASK